MRKILSTYALIYANGQAHLGHMLGFIQTDIFCRFQRLRGNACYYISGADMHGTPIMIKAQEKGLNPAQMTREISEAQQKSIEGFHVKFDEFYHTDSDENRALSYQFYERLLAKGSILRKTISQAFDESKQMFLPDRFIKGTCPICKTPDQYGDSCEHCGATYSPTELIDAVSVLSGEKPTTKDSEHFFFDLPQYESLLRDWIQDEAHVQPSVANKLKEWLEAGLKPWDISRDAPYFGFEIPGESQKYFYVWLDAPIGYLASFQHYANRHSTDSNSASALFDEYFSLQSTAELYHFIGKDITYFHTLFWPALLNGADKRLPSGVHTHGFLTVNGKKMSKSRGTFITADRYLRHLDPEYLRYYFAAKLSADVEDIDLNLTDFTLRVNSDLVGKIVNIASRSAGFLKKYFENRLSAELFEPALFEPFQTAAALIADDFEAREYASAVRRIMALADLANQFIDAHKPWASIKEPDQTLPQSKTHQVCTQGLNFFRQLMIFLSPIVPNLAKKATQFLQTPDFTWDDISSQLLDHPIADFIPMMTRVDPSALEAMLHDTDG